MPVQTIPCIKELIQPAPFEECGLYEYYLSTGKRTRGSFCDATYATSLLIKTTGSFNKHIVGS